MLILKIITILLPWHFKRLILKNVFKYEINKSARIGFSWIYPEKLIMESNAKIGSLNVAIHLDFMSIGKNSSISRGNWITGFSTKKSSKHFAHQIGRSSSLLIGEHSAITKNHHIDCTNLIYIGNFSTIAGYSSQFLTHSIDILEGRQNSLPIMIGDYCFVSSNVTVLGGSILPSYSVLGAKALLNKKFNQEYSLYGGVPAIFIKNISNEAKYFKRKIGFIY
jgi:acetyltransferase-like isoleucine patch superfamily enzyme